MARLLEKYRKEIVPVFVSSGKYSSPMAAPRLEKVVLNMGVGKATENRARVQAAAKDLALIAGQRPAMTKAKQSVAGFKLRQGQEIGCKVTLRGRRMYEFMDRLICTAIPRIRDFRGLDPHAVDGRRSYTMGVTEQWVFPEIEIDKVEFTQGLDVTIVTTARSPEETVDLLRALGMPFRDE